MRRIAICVSGKVQGVFFRASAKAKADQLGINGFVRNEIDGGVYLEAEGNEQTLIEFKAWCEEGPSQARVLTCDVKEIDSKGTTGFLIAR